MKGFVYRAAAALISIAAFVIRLFVRQRDMILLISCQSDEPTRDILDLAEAIRGISAVPSSVQNAPRVKVMAGRMERSAGGAFSFAGKLLSMLKHLAAARIVVLDAYCPAVSIPGKIKGQKVVQIWHAPEAIKKFSWQIVDTQAGYDSSMAKALKMHRNYDCIICPSDATRPFFAEAFGYPESVFVKYGLPTLDRIGAVKRPGTGELESPERIKARTAIYGKYPELDSVGRPLTIVYAPTFRDGTEIDATGLVKAFEKAHSGGFVIVLKLHPLDAIKNADAMRVQDETWLRDESCVIIDTVFPLIDWYAAADVIITDYSGAAVEAAAADVASYYYIYDIDEYKKRRGLNVDLRDEVVGKYAFTDAEMLAEQVFKDFPSVRDSLYDYQALSDFTCKYMGVPLKGNAINLALFVAKL